MVMLLVIILPVIFAVTSYAYADPVITLSIDDVRSPFLNTTGVQASLTASKESLLDVQLDEVAIQGKVWRGLRFSCRKFQIDDGLVRCNKGVLTSARSAPLLISFQFSSRHKTLDVKIQTSSNEGSEDWSLSAHWGKPAWEGMLTVKNGDISRIAEFLPVGEKEILPMPIQGKGKINGSIKLHGDADGLAGVDANLALDGLAFSDVSGLHAGENIRGEINAKAVREGNGQDRLWKWNADVNWPSGEVFWQPLYFSAQGQRLTASGELNENIIRILEGKFVLSGIGEMDLSGVIERPTNTLRDFDLSADNLELSMLFSQVLKPFLASTPFAELKAAGQAGIRWRYRNSAHESLDVNLRDVLLEDERGRFAFRGVNARIPWQMQGANGNHEPTTGDIHIQSSQLGRIPIGQLHIPLKMDGMNLSIPRLTVPVLDGALTLENFSASRKEGWPQGWQWQFSGGLSPISMQKLTEALGVQPMHGTLSGEIPQVTYDGSTVEVEGALLVRVFDGTVLLWNLKALDPLGPAAALMADVDMRNLDLNLLTGTFSFGNMQGRVDVAVHDLELFNWKPVKFDASLASSPGKYPRRISQAAVQNISSLGGQGAAAVIQRSFLHFFDDFGYSKIGWSCSLRNGICHMDGIASEPMPHGYLIVKGGGIPAITVIGYNREVDWWELVSRLQRITQVSPKPIIN
jgi:hypothetical protein